MKKLHVLAILTLAIAALFPSCKKDDPTPPNESELITTVSLTLVDSATGLQTVTLTFRDLDGDGGIDPVITGGSLQPNTTYNGQLALLDESKTPIDEITAEIEEEADEHQFFFKATPGSLLAYLKYLDTDINGKPVGLQFRLKSGSSGSGNFTVILRHQPDKNASGVSDGNITNAGGETDIEVTFPLSIVI